MPENGTPAAWDELVTKDHLDLKLDAMTDRLAARFEERLNVAMTTQTRSIIFGQVGAVVATAVAVIAAAQLA